MDQRTAAPARPQEQGTEARRRSPSLVATALAVVLSACCSILLLWPQHGFVLNWDEVDYVHAAREGVLTNLWERGSLSIPAYVRFAMDKVRHDEPRLPAGYDESNDPFKLRHGHSPAVVAAMAPTSHSQSERLNRAVQLVGAVALTVALVVAYSLVSPARTWAGLLAVLLVAPWYNWHLFRNIQFHGWAAVWLCLAVASLCRWLTLGRPRSWGLALCASISLLILTLETSAFVIIAVILCLFIWVRPLGRRAQVPWIRRYVLPGLLTVLVMTTAVWPGLVVKGALLKLPAERYYQVFLGEGTVYHFSSSADVLSYLLPTALAVLTLTYLWRQWRRHDELLRWAPLVVVAAVYVISVVRFAVSETYFLPAMVPVLVLFAWVASDIPRRFQTPVVVALALVMLAGTASVLGANDRNRQADQRTRDDLAFVGDFVGTSRGLMDGAHVFRHYLPGRDIENVSYNASGLLVRRSGKYEPVPPSQYQGSVVGILGTRKAFLEGAGAKELSVHCPRIVRPTVVIWDCRRFSP